MTTNADRAIRSAATSGIPRPAQMRLADMKSRAAHQVGERLKVLAEYLGSGVPVLDAGQLQELQRACLLLRPSLAPAAGTNDTPDMAEVAKLVGEVYKAGVYRTLTWDVRNITTLVDMLPRLVPQSCRDRAVRAYVADDEVGEATGNGQWMLEFDPHTPRPNILAAGQVTPETQALARLVSCASNPSYLAQLMPQVHAAQARFNEDLPKLQGKDVLESINTFARVLNEAVRAFYLDTADYNNWDTVKTAAQAKYPDTLPFSYFSTFCPTTETATRLQELVDDIQRDRAALALHRAPADGNTAEVDGDEAPAVTRQRCTGG